MKIVNVAEKIDQSKFTRFHRMILLLSCFLVCFDGLEIGLLGTIATPLIKEWSLDPIQFGVISSYAAVGMILGGLVCGPLGDKIGRIKLILVSAFFYSFFTLMGGFSYGLLDFGIYRFLAGLGMGGIVPTTVGLITDYSPKKTRSSIVATVTTFIGIGGVLSSLIGIFMLPAFGWRSMFIIGGLPLIGLPFIYKFLPESPLMLLRKGKIEQLVKVLNRLSYGEIFTREQKYEMRVETKAKIPFTALFQNKMAWGTLFIWLTFLFSYIVTFAIIAWLPNLMVKAGYPLGSSLLFMTVNGLGATVGSLSGGKIADKTGLKKIIVLFFILGGISLMVLGIKFTSIFLLYLIVFSAGWGITGSQNLLLAFCSQFYPTEIRSTGIASATILGRVGSLVGPLFAGMLLTMGATIAMCFMAFGVIAFMAAISLSCVKERNANVTAKVDDSVLHVN